MLLLPGHLCTAALWSNQIEALGDRVDCIVPSYRLGDSISQFAADVLGWAPAQFSLAAFSMGGFVAAEMVRQAPHRVRRLALVGSRCDVDGPDRLRQRERDIALVREQGFESLLPLLPRRWLSPAYQSESAFADLLARMAREVGEEGFFRQQRALIQRNDSAPALSRVQCPTLIIAGEMDRPNPPEKQRRLQALIPHARYVSVQLAGHMLPLEAPSELTSALSDWLTR
jgi:pimeloyl-ACP methyl ester carboxylesterase